MAFRGDGFAAVVLAAGAGTRMESPLAKVLHPVGGQPMIRWVVNRAKEAGAAPVVVVVGHQAEDVRRALSGEDVLFAHQEQRRGTGHATGVGLASLPTQEGHLFVLCGDAPLLRTSTLKRLGRHHAEAGAAATMLTTILDDPHGYGRVLRAGEDLLGVVEQADATREQRKIREVNTGAYAFEVSFLCDALPRLGADNNQREYYLPDVFPLARAKGRVVLGLALATPEEALGVNTREDLRRAEEVHARWGAS